MEFGFGFDNTDDYLATKMIEDDDWFDDDNLDEFLFPKYNFDDRRPDFRIVYVAGAGQKTPIPSSLAKLVHSRDK